MCYKVGPLKLGGSFKVKSKGKDKHERDCGKEEIKRIKYRVHSMHGRDQIKQEGREMRNAPLSGREKMTMRACMRARRGWGTTTRKEEGEGKLACEACMKWRSVGVVVKRERLQVLPWKL